MISIVDYGLGNALAFANVYKRLNIDCAIARTADDLDAATRVILPGVGAFDQAMDLLERSGMRPRLTELVARGMPILGICVGMQMLARSSEEGDRPGLGWIAGSVRRLPAGGNGFRTPLPHMGWNAISPRKEASLLDGLTASPEFYFLHSYGFHCETADDVLADVHYGSSFPSAVNSENVYGVQFHPEKSHENGVRLLQNFAEI